MKKLLFVYNPHAGKAKIRGLLGDLIAVFDDADYEVTVRPTRKAGDAAQFVRKFAEDYDRIVVSGGDGTLNEALCGVCNAATDGKRRPELGFIPTGSTNDFAKSLKIPSDPLVAAKIAVTGDLFPCDAGSFNGHPFTYVAAFGAFTKVSYATPQKIKNLFGHFAYIIEGAKELTHIRGLNLTVQTDEETFSGKYLYGMVSNATSVGGFDGFFNDLNVALNDGLLEVVLVKEPKTVAEKSALLADLMRMNMKSRFFTTLKTRRITFETAENLPLPWTLDGEFGGEPNLAEISVIPEAYSIVVPKSEEN
ncbi:MAG: diacylglycerol kinase family lipid kinase [Clostridia bacterium]|nr:diacylglycerol kinase family lipid kinase [Clostridia bacterium]